MANRLIQSISPYTQQIQNQFDYSNGEELNKILENGTQAVKKQLATPVHQRSELFLNLQELLEKDKNKLGELITQEMGKPILQSIAEVEKCAQLCGFYAANAEKWLQPRVIEKNEAGEKRVEYHPLGLILGIMPWNFPFWQVFRCAVPALSAGNTIVMKHAPNVPTCALKIEELFRVAGFEQGVYQNLFVAEEQVEQVLSDDRVKAVSLTGSEKAGRSVAALAGKHLKKQVLELGGSDPFIVLPTANVKLAAETAVKARMISNGQSCIAAKRFLVDEKIYDQFISLVKQELSVLKFGNPMEPSVNIGPLARRDLADQLRKQVQQGVEAGATIEAEYFFETDNLNFVPVTLLGNIKKDNPAYSQELFGPVFSIYKFKNREEALTLANDTPFGLGSSIWTNDTEEQSFFIRYLEAGSVFVNSMVVSNEALPFGGVKSSGYGRELSEEGLKEFCNVKAAAISFLP
ncbi:MAG: putative aldehyde dehydrogenase [Chitinophagaceae bacterium]|nr:putative aldehyde dehydrogenase [Chitinophagaceae bacterium]